MMPEVTSLKDQISEIEKLLDAHRAALTDIEDALIGPEPAVGASNAIGYSQTIPGRLAALTDGMRTNADRLERLRSIVGRPSELSVGSMLGAWAGQQEFCVKQQANVRSGY